MSYAAMWKEIGDYLGFTIKNDEEFAEMVAWGFESEAEQDDILAIIEKYAGQKRLHWKYLHWPIEEG